MTAEHSYQFTSAIPPYGASYGETFIEQGGHTYDNPYKFNGKELDEETGLYYYGARYYDPKISLWLSVDPLAEKYPGVSPFAYTYGNPLKFVDPTGMEGEAWDDWIKNLKTGEYEWRNEVTSPENTPEGYKYVGKTDQSIVYDLFGKTNFSVERTAMGLLRVSQSLGKGVSGMFPQFVRIKTKLNVSLRANVKTIYSNGKLVSKNFEGISIDITASTPYLTMKNHDGQLITLSPHTSVVDINGIKIEPIFQYTTPVLLQGGDAPTLPFSHFIPQSELYKYYPAISITFSGNYIDAKNQSAILKPITKIGISGFWSHSALEVNMNVIIPYK